MNDSLDKKTVAIKTLAIVGFFATFALIVWLVVQGVRLAPGAFSSLASIAESLQQYRPVTELSIGMEKDVVNSGESFKLSWSDMRQKGTYRFSYTCVDGVSVDVRGTDNNLLSVPCTGNLSLSSDVHGLFLSFNSEKNRFVDVPFIIAFEGEHGGTKIERRATITVANATIPSETKEPVATTTKQANSGEQRPSPTKNTAETASAITSVVHSEGYVDLKTSFLGIGTMDGNTFVPAAQYDPTLRAGIKFDIANVGTKTSGPWAFTATLPSGQLYSSDVQPALNPGDHVVFTLGFNVNTSTTDKYVRVTVKATEQHDTNGANDSFTWAVLMK